MNFNWCDYYSLATDLDEQAADAGNAEALLRSSLSRAYYAAFQVARQDLETRGQFAAGKDDNKHRYVYQAFRSDTDRKRKKIALEIDRLRQDRNHADYDDVVQGLEQMASSALIRARRVLKWLGHLQEP